MGSFRCLLLLLLMLAIACEPTSPQTTAPAPLSPGLSLSGPVDKTQALLRQVAAAPEAMEETRLASAATLALKRISGCKGSVVGHGALDFLDLLDHLTCATEQNASSAINVTAVNAAHKLLARASLHVDTKSLTGELELGEGARNDFGSLFAQDGKTAVPWEVPKDALASAAIHATSFVIPAAVLRALGLEDTTTVRRALSTTLTGRWGGLLLPYDAARPQFRFLLSAESTSELLLRTALAETVDTLSRRYDFDVEAVDGMMCARGLALVPGFSPCWRQQGTWLVVGWNRASMLPAASPTAASAALSLHFDRIEALDLNADQVPRVAQPFSTLTLTPTRPPGGWRLSATWRSSVSR